MSCQPLAQKQLGVVRCSCICHRVEANDKSEHDRATAAASSSSGTKSCGENNDFLESGYCHRPTMHQLQCMVHIGDWGGIQNAILADASVAMRIDDSREEDMWFDAARRAKAEQDGVDVSSMNSVAATSNDQDEDVQSDLDGDSHPPPMQLRYWVGNQPRNNDTDLKARVEMRNKRTLLHSLCGKSFPSNEALIVQLTHNDSSGFKNLMGAVKTARMLVAASHNVPFTSFECSSDKGENTNMKQSSGREDRCCMCYYYRHYCPPVPRMQEDDQKTVWRVNTHTENSEEYHTSVLSMIDKMGETPLHSLTGRGMSHEDLVDVFISSCQPLDEPSSDGSDRRPTVYDLIVAQNFSGLTPLHFLADSKNEEAISLLLQQCQPCTHRAHPIMIYDNEGDLPLHYAACNGAHPSLLRTLLGNGDPSLVRNLNGRLAIDDFLEEYIERLQEDESLWEEDVETSEIESEDETAGGESSSISASENGDEQDTGECHPIVENGAVTEDNVDLVSYALCNFDLFSARTDWEGDLGESISLLIQAAATLIVNNVDQTTADTQSGDNNRLPPIHAAVLVTSSYANYPAVCLPIIMSLQCNGGEGINDESMKQLLKEEDIWGNVPLHWACENLSLLVDPSMEACTRNIATELNRGNSGPLVPNTTECKDLARWKTNGLPSLVEYLLHIEPSASLMPTRQGSLPLHLLVGRPWDDIALLLKEYPDALGKQDLKTMLYPFQVAAISHKTLTDPASGLLSLDNTYRLIMEDPTLLCQIIER